MSGTFVKIFQGFPNAGEYNPSIHRFRTSSSMINIAGAGGLAFSTLSEIWGPPKGGKSTLVYQSIGEFLIDYGPNALVLILDSENSADFLRLKHVFGIKIGNHPHVRDGDPRVCIEPAFTIEQGVEHIMRYAERARKEGKFLAVVWDSITTSKPKREYEYINQVLKAEMPDHTESGGVDKRKEQFGTNMSLNQLRPQIIKWGLNQIMSAIYLQPVIVFLINQATTKLTMYGASESSGGGYAFKHNIHYSIRIRFSKKIGENPVFYTGTLSEMSVEKSKVIPSLTDIKFFIRDDLGGRLEPQSELVMAAKDMGIVVDKSGGWLNIKDEYLPDPCPPELKKAMQLKVLTQNPIALEAVSDAVESQLRKTFNLLDLTYQDREEQLAAEADKKASTTKKK